MTSMADLQYFLLVIGLDSSGKSTMLENYKEGIAGEKVILPTPGLAMGTLALSGRRVVYFDCSGDGRHRYQWFDYFAEVHAILFVVDSTDQNRFPIVKDYLKEIFKDEILNKRQVPILVACNKQDSEAAIDKSDLETELMLSKIANKENTKYTIINTSGYENKGLKEGLEWLSKNVSINTMKKAN